MDFKNELTDSLHSAIAAGAYSTCEDLLAQGANPNGKDSYGYTPLIKAIEKKQSNCIRLLLASGAKLGEKIYRQSVFEYAFGKLGHGDIQFLCEEFERQKLPLPKISIDYFKEQFDWGEKVSISKLREHLLVLEVLKKYFPGRSSDIEFCSEELQKKIDVVPVSENDSLWYDRITAVLGTAITNHIDAYRIRCIVTELLTLPIALNQPDWSKVVRYLFTINPSLALISKEIMGKERSIEKLAKDSHFTEWYENYHLFSYDYILRLLGSKGLEQSDEWKALVLEAADAKWETMGPIDVCDFEARAFLKEPHIKNSEYFTEISQRINERFPTAGVLK